MEMAVSLDYPLSWPLLLQEAAEDGARQIERRRAGATATLLPQSTSGAIAKELSDRGIVVYHCSRLLADEVRDIRASGLRAASSALLSDKVTAACRAGLLTQAQAERIVGRGVLASRDQQPGRIGAICALTTLQTVSVDPHGVKPFFEYWGGEITYFWQLGTSGLGLNETLRSIGEPALIKFIHHPQTTDCYAPDLSTLVINLWRRSTAESGEVHIKVQPGTRLPVTNILHPGDPQWPDAVIAGRGLDL
ncbi:hypothetical protein [Rhodococcus tibetensis]|uniref:Uncharacterized protein n=1 Tax=Rhodococcus tibetensis TaxID=2965064 RepID=A0ABT1Q809_9NOCA|nr:hypothetical protein [Rhodococcus sp. FXJ9.536]MCQ4118381.1 hypothetical protein [Rhodococcus sp. FXJ9.536]